MGIVIIPNMQIDGQPCGRASWRWLRGLLSWTVGEAAATVGQDGTAEAAIPFVAADRTRMRPARSPEGGAAILPFPIHGEALLVKLAAVLRRRVGHAAPEQDPLLLQITRGAGSRLSIDQAAVVEFNPERREYRAVIEAQPSTRLILETTDFDALVDFVLPYVAGRLASPREQEATS